MAIPKICGQETEYSAALVCPDGRISQYFGSRTICELIMEESYSILPGPRNFCIKEDYYQRKKYENKSPITGRLSSERWRYSTGGYGYYDGDGGFRVNGSRLYLENRFLIEYASQEYVSARDLTAAVIAGDRILSRVCEEVNKTLSPGKKVQIFANNSDGKCTSWGTHLNFLVLRATFDRFYNNLRSPHYIHKILPAFIVSSIPLSGSGKVGSEDKELPPCDFQLSSRSDFMQQVVGLETSQNRPLLNTRDEPWADKQNFARFHLTCIDRKRLEFSIWLEIGSWQLLLAMLEDDYFQNCLFLKDPVLSLKEVSRDISLTKTIELEDGRLTALELQEIFTQKMKEYVAEGRADGIIPEAKEIVEEREDVIETLKSDPLKLVGKLDWVTKYYLILSELDRKRVDFSHPFAKWLDLQYGNISEEGLYDCLLKRGLVYRVTTDKKIEYFMENGCEHTRSSIRSKYLKENTVQYVDWERVVVELNMDKPFLERKVKK